jgi:hypothetical protein
MGETREVRRPKCSRCGVVMDETTRIVPFGDDPGLLIFECSGCGSATSRFDPPHTAVSSKN